MTDEVEAVAQPAAAACRCGLLEPAPWRGRDLPWSPASVVAGLLTLAFAVLAAVAGREPWVAPVLLTILLVGSLAAFVVLGRRGHRGACRIGRSAWMGLAAFGLPLRMAAGLAV